MSKKTVTNIQTTLFHFHDGVISENSKNESGNYLLEEGATHLLVLSVDGIPVESKILDDEMEATGINILSNIKIG